MYKIIEVEPSQMRKVTSANSIQNGNLFESEYSPKIEKGTIISNIETMEEAKSLKIRLENQNPYNRYEIKET